MRSHARNVTLIPDDPAFFVLSPLAYASGWDQLSRQCLGASDQASPGFLTRLLDQAS